MIDRLTTTVLLIFFGVGLGGCSSRPIPSESSSVVETFGGSEVLSGVELTCLGLRKELTSALTKNQNNLEGFQKAVFDSGDVAAAQQVLDRFGERWSRVVRVGVYSQAGDCAAKVFVRSLQASIDGGSSDLGVSASDTRTFSKGFSECRN